MQNKWRNAAIEAAGAGFNGAAFRQQRRERSHVRDRTAPRVSGAAWLHETISGRRHQRREGPFNDARSQC